MPINVGCMFVYLFSISKKFEFEENVMQKFELSFGKNE